MIEPEHLRLGAGLAHAVPGAELLLHTDVGEPVIVGRRPDADLSPCQLRAVLASPAATDTSRPADRIVQVEVTGQAEHVGGGVVRSQTPCGLEQRSVATTLSWGAVAEILHGIEADVDDDLPADALQAQVRPDPELGVTVVTITSIDARFDSFVDGVAAMVSARCMVDELVATPISHQ